MVFAKWTIWKQLKKFQFPKTVEAGKSMNLNNEEFVNLVETKDKDTRILNDTIPPPSSHGHHS